MTPEPLALHRVALSVWERHHTQFIEQLHELRDDWLAMRQARHKRSRLLWTARKLNLRHCLGKLRDPGMTLVRNGRRSMFCYDTRSTNTWRVTLRQRCQHLQAMRGTSRHDNLDLIKANIQGLLTESEQVNGSGLRVRWTLPEVTLEDVYIGDMEVTLDLMEFAIVVNNLTFPGDEKLYPHPHVDGAGRICWNFYEVEARQLHRAGEFLALKDLIDNLLNTYNGHSPYISLDEWVDGPGSYCSACDERCHPDELSWSQSYGGDLCPECCNWCERCDYCVHYNQYNIDMEACQDCVDEHAVRCTECGRLAFPEHMEPVEAPFFEQQHVVYLCDDCTVLHEHLLEQSKEQDDEKQASPEFFDSGDSDPTGLLAPAVDAASHAV